MSIFTLPDDALPELKLPRGYCLDWTRITPSGSAVECNLYFPEDDAGYCLGMANAEGNTVADAFLALFADPILGDAVIPAEVAAALDELAHQAARVVCNRLSGGTLDEATFAEPHLLDTQSGPIERSVVTLPGSAPGTMVLPQRYDTLSQGAPLD